MVVTYSKEQDAIIKDIKKFILDNNCFPSKHQLQKSKGFSCGYEKAYKMFGGTGPLKKACGWLDWKSAETAEDYIKLYESKGLTKEDCLEWLSLDSKQEYGVIQKDNKQYKIHRLIWELYNNQTIPFEHVIMHVCNNKKCFNIHHLKLGTVAENTKAAIEDKLFNPILNLSISYNFKTIDDALRFYIDKATPLAECLLLDKDYASLHFKGNKYLIHRLIVAIKENLEYSDTSWVARHTCNNKKCINEKHLISGTKSDNARDSAKFKKSTKLTEDNVKEILQSFSKYSDKLLKTFDIEHALKFGVSPTTIKSIRLGNTWKHIYKEFNNETN